MRRRWRILAVAGLPLLIAGFLYAGSHLWLQRAANSVQNPALGWHVLTQSRVLWQYAWRMFLPLRQCSDHLIPLTSDTGDVVAWISLGALLALLLFIRRLHRRNHRAAALLLSLTLAPLILRFFYMAPDPMVEYRTYPALPWFALVVAFLAAKATPRAALRGWRRAMCAALVLLAALCIRRSLVWQNPRSLVADIVGQYPLHVRPLSYLQWFDSNSGHLDDVIRRQEDIGKRLNAVLEFNRFSRIYHRRHDAPGAVAQFMLCEQFAGYALIGKGDPAQAIDRMTQVIQVAQRFFGTDDAKAFAVLYRVRGKAKAAQGDTAGAAEDYRRCLGRKPGDPEALALLGEIGASPASP
jgi:tetratricopeptide (TPR) repeat protein